MNFDTSPIEAEKLQFASDLERVKTETTRNPKESQVFYMQRSGRAVVSHLREEKGTLFDPSRLRESDVDSDTRDVVAQIMKSSLLPNDSELKYNQELNAQALEVIETLVSYHEKSGMSTGDQFDTTERNRKFFETNPGSPSSKRETYWNTLFFPLLTPECRDFAREYLYQKNIVLLGGGRSRLREELKGNDISPKAILNVDPYVENPEEGSDTVIPISATSKYFHEGISSALGGERADEIWAEYSVPAYLDDPEEIYQLFDNIDQILAENGTARIWPLEVGGSGDDDAKVNRKKALIESLRKMDSSRRYGITVYKSAGRSGITLHKIAGQVE